MPTTDSSTLSIGMQIFYARMLLKRLLPLLIHTQFGVPGRIPRGMGKVMRYLRLGSLAVNKTPLTEGSPPAGKSLTTTYVDVTMKQFGDFVTLTDVVKTQVFDPLLGDLMPVMAEQAGLSIDSYTCDILNAGTNVQYAAGRVSRVTVANTDKYTAAEGLKAKRTLENANVLRIGGYYYAYAHPNTLYDLRQDSRWVNANSYVDNSNLKNGEEGELDGIRYLRSTNTGKFTGAGAGGIDVYSTLVFGQNWYTTASYEAPESGGSTPEMDGEATSLPVELILKELGSGGTSDPLNQISTLAWKVAYETVISNQNCGVRVEHAVSP